MSVKAMAWAKAQKAGGPGIKAVLLVLADYADEQWSCFPGQQRIAEETEQSIRTVRAQLETLERRVRVPKTYAARVKALQSAVERSVCAGPVLARPEVG